MGSACLKGRRRASVRQAGQVHRGGFRRSRRPRRHLVGYSMEARAGNQLVGGFQGSPRDHQNLSNCPLGCSV